MVVKSASATASMSVIEQKLRKHSKRLCWGCGSPEHSYSLKGGTVICPKKHLPEVKEQVEKAYADFKKNREKREGRKGKRQFRELVNTVFRTMLTEDLRVLVSQKTSKSNKDSTPLINHRSFPVFANFNADI
eukprot:1078361-Ditylum_brightwellii.AAC.1